MSLFEFKDVDRTYYKEKLEDFLPGSIFDVHTHVYVAQPPMKGEVRTVTWPSVPIASNSGQTTVLSSIWSKKMLPRP